VFRQHYNTDARDASLLLMPLVRFLPIDDRRLRAPVRAIADELTGTAWSCAYRVEKTDDGFSGEEGTVLMCSHVGVAAQRVAGLVARMVEPIAPNLAALRRVSSKLERA
jgi:GH15 family glucan-1,4-alpha-glucosidase